VELAIMTAPRLHDVAPELETELRELLQEEGEAALAEQVADLAIFDRCRCGDSFCSTFYTVPNRTAPYPPDHLTLALASGLLLDVIDGKIVCVEVLYRDDLRTKIHAAVP
jgi:hypothetical protein